MTQILIHGSALPHLVQEVQGVTVSHCWQGGGEWVRTESNTRILVVLLSSAVSQVNALMVYTTSN